MAAAGGAGVSSQMFRWDPSEKTDAFRLALNQSRRAILEVALAVLPKEKKEPYKIPSPIVSMTPADLLGVIAEKLRRVTSLLRGLEDQYFGVDARLEFIHTSKGETLLLKGDFYKYFRYLAYRSFMQAAEGCIEYPLEPLRDDLQERFLSDHPKPLMPLTFIPWDPTQTSGTLWLQVEQLPSYPADVEQYGALYIGGTRLDADRPLIGGLEKEKTAIMPGATFLEAFGISPIDRATLPQVISARILPLKFPPMVLSRGSSSGYACQRICQELPILCLNYKDFPEGFRSPIVIPYYQGFKGEQIVLTEILSLEGPFDMSSSLGTKRVDASIRKVVAQMVAWKDRFNFNRLFFKFRQEGHFLRLSDSYAGEGLKIREDNLGEYDPVHLELNIGLVSDPKAPFKHHRYVVIYLTGIFFAGQAAGPGLGEIATTFLLKAETVREVTRHYLRELDTQIREINALMAFFNNERLERYNGALKIDSRADTLRSALLEARRSRAKGESRQHYFNRLQALCKKDSDAGKKAFTARFKTIEESSIVLHSKKLHSCFNYLINGCYAEDRILEWAEVMECLGALGFSITREAEYFYEFIFGGQKKELVSLFNECLETALTHHLDPMLGAVGLTESWPLSVSAYMAIYDLLMVNGFTEKSVVLHEGVK